MSDINLYIMLVWVGLIKDLFILTLMCVFSITLQIVNVYITEYDSGGKYWPIAHNSIIFSLVLAQIIAMGVFVLKDSTLCLGFTIPLPILTLLFNEYCRRRFLPVFKNIAAEVTPLLFIVYSHLFCLSLFCYRVKK